MYFSKHCTSRPSGFAPFISAQYRPACFAPHVSPRTSRVSPRTTRALPRTTRVSPRTSRPHVLPSRYCPARLSTHVWLRTSRRAGFAPHISPRSAVQLAPHVSHRWFRPAHLAPLVTPRTSRPTSLSRKSRIANLILYILPCLSPRPVPLPPTCSYMLSAAGNNQFFWSSSCFVLMHFLRGCYKTLCGAAQGNAALCGGVGARGIGKRECSGRKTGSVVDEKTGNVVVFQSGNIVIPGSGQT